MFMREVADMHRELFAEHADLYGANVAAKIERCLAVTDAEYEAGARPRERYRERSPSLGGRRPASSRPTLPCVAPPAGTTSASCASRLTR